MRKLSCKKIISGKLKLITGMHIGGSKDSVGIGDVDSPVIRQTLNQEPYIPGSSLKGKMRGLLQLIDGEVDETAKMGSRICELFGARDGKNKELGNPSRLIVRDSYLSASSSKALLESAHTDMPFSEIKTENRISRVEGKAEHPRQIERVPAGVSFNLNMVLNVFEGDDESKLLSTLKAGLKSLQDDYIGGSGSRGYGQLEIDIDWDQVETRNAAYYSQL